MSILLYECTTWRLTNHMEEKLDGNYTRMLRAILNKSYKKHLTKQQLYGHLPPIAKTIKVKRTRHAGHCWRSRDKLISDVLLWTPSHGRTKAGRLVTYNNSASIQDVALKIYREWGKIEKGGRRGSRRSVLISRHIDDNDIYIYVCVCLCVCVCVYLVGFYGVYIYIYILLSVFV